MPSRGRPFQRGVSGNPGGRPKVDPEVKALLDEMTPEAIKTLGEIMRNKKAQASARATAALGILRKTVPDLSSQELKAEMVAMLFGCQWWRPRLRPGSSLSSHRPESDLF
jgi:hypothetical protein